MESVTARRRLGAPLGARDDRGGDRGDRSARNPETTPSAADEDVHLCCSACGAAITSVALRSEQAGRHEHLCANPEGVLFRIGCFAQAPGCVPFGRPTSRWTWFPDHRWQVALCARCGAHLGWRFQDGGGSSFFGLIVDRLVECGSGSAH